MIVTKPLVSVLMTAYNREQYLAEAIESVLASTFTHFELIIADDCSTDRTVEIAKSYASRDSRVSIPSMRRILATIQIAIAQHRWLAEGILNTLIRTIISTHMDWP